MPPAGGFESIKYKRNLPLRGPSGIVILAGVVAVCGFGFYRLGQGNLEKRWVTCHFVAERARFFARSAGAVERGTTIAVLVEERVYHVRIGIRPQLLSFDRCLRYA